MMKANNVLAFVLSAAAIVASAGYNEYTSTVTDGIKDVTLTVNDTVITDKLSEEGVDTLRFTRSSSFYAVKLRSTGGNNLPGGVMADGYMIKIQNANVFGTGPLQLLNQWSSLYVDYMPNSGDVVDVPNRVEFDTISSFAAAVPPYGLALHNIGVTANNADKVITLGRENTGAANLTLALDGDQNDAISKFNLRGNLSLTVDGGTLRAAAGAARDLFVKADANATPNISILNEPLTIDAAAGSPVRFGVAPSFSGVKTIDVFREEIKPTNWSFETTSGWTFVSGAGGAGGYYQNNSAFDSNNLYPTTNGTHYAMMRRGGSVYQNIPFAKGGKYRVIFERGCRGGNYSKGISLTVSIDDTPLTVFPALSAPTGFTQLETDFVNLTAAEHKLSFALSETATDNYGSLNIDAVRLERYETVTPGFEIAKTGAGTFVLNDFNVNDLAVNVQAGTLACENTILPNAAVTVANGAELNAAGLTAAGTTIDVSAGGRVSFRALEDVNLVANGSFETPETSDYSFYWASACGWNLEPTADPRPGIQRNGGTYTKTADKTPYGNQTLYLRTATSASQTVNVPKDGTYELSYWACTRTGYPSLALTVTIDGTAQQSGLTFGADEYVRTTKKVLLTKGNHTLKFEAAAGGHQYALMFIDNVSLADATVQPSDLSETTLQLKSGSIVRLDNTEKVVVGSATVDGVEVNGGAATLRRAGVIVEGEGRIQCGPPRGLILLVR